MVFPKYLEQAMMEFHQTLQRHWYPQDGTFIHVIEKYGLGANSWVIVLRYSLSTAFWFILEYLEQAMMEIQQILPTHWYSQDEHLY